MFCQDICQQLGHPFFDGVRVAVDERADAEDRSMPLPNRDVVACILTWRNVAVLRQTNKASLRDVAGVIFSCAVAIVNSLLMLERCGVEIDARCQRVS